MTVQVRLAKVDENVDGFFVFGFSIGCCGSCDFSAIRRVDRSLHNGSANENVHDHAGEPALLGQKFGRQRFWVCSLFGGGFVGISVYSKFRISTGDRPDITRL